jgi:hypothetical protein
MFLPKRSVMSGKINRVSQIIVYRAKLASQPRRPAAKKRTGGSPLRRASVGGACPRVWIVPAAIYQVV